MHCIAPRLVTMVFFSALAIAMAVIAAVLAALAGHGGLLNCYTDSGSCTFDNFDHF